MLTRLWLWGVNSASWTCRLCVRELMAPSEVLWTTRQQKPGKQVSKHAAIHQRCNVETLLSQGVFDTDRSHIAWLFNDSCWGYETEKK